MARVAARIIVRGRVQGVGFRWFTRDAAEALSAPGHALRGWVANRRDGSVELEVAGDGDLVARFIERLRRGPPAAAVSALDVQWLPAPVAGEAEDGEGARGSDAAIDAGTPREAAAARFEIRPTT